MGVLAPETAHTRPSAQPPIDTSEHLSAHMSSESPLNISPNRLELISKDNFWNVNLAAIL
jgi:hypothetical protein